MGSFSRVVSKCGDKCVTSSRPPVLGPGRLTGSTVPPTTFSLAFSKVEAAYRICYHNYKEVRERSAVGIAARAVEGDLRHSRDGHGVLPVSAASLFFSSVTIKIG